MPAEYQFIRVERDEPIATVFLNRPEKLNALNWALMGEVADALEAFDADDAIHCTVITGTGERAFAAGADIEEMSDKTPVDMALGAFNAWSRIRRIKKPMIAAVAGFALGGGNELAMHCDIIIASEKARFGQPEILIGVLPGGGGTQRITRVAGKFRAMELCLTGRQATAQEMFEMGLVNRVVPQGQHLEEAQKMARQIASLAPVATILTKEAILMAYETPLDAGLDYEKRLFALLFSTEDQKEGMRAFLEKRPPAFTGR